MKTETEINEEIDKYLSQKISNYQRGYIRALWWVLNKEFRKDKKDVA